MLCIQAMHKEYNLPEYDQSIGQEVEYDDVAEGYVDVSSVVWFLFTDIPCFNFLFWLFCDV